MLLHSKSDIMFLKKKKGYFMSKYENLEKKSIFNEYGKNLNEKIDQKSNQ